MTNFLMIAIINVLPYCHSNDFSDRVNKGNNKA